MATVSSKVLEYERFVNDVLKEDLRKSIQLKTDLLGELKEYEDLEANLLLLQREGLQQLKSQVELGMGVRCEALVPDTSNVFINIDAPRVIALRKVALAAQVARVLQQVAQRDLHSLCPRAANSTTSQPAKQPRQCTNEVGSAPPAESARSCGGPCGPAVATGGSRATGAAEGLAASILAPQAAYCGQSRTACEPKNLSFSSNVRLQQPCNPLIELELG
ncbi:uncharacterized protein HaLaN_25334 [Haematococcus lacustris]|uniref:Uncharacterized protein n=1 Tax=Haematococcus lacustris TaxID=44745 RepID=A0A6A0A3W0_HAELA|nr:uncharacterized protein HaLaN_25334 [Haematococcus lacustris]